jgi:hypothetical protein
MKSQDHVDDIYHTGWVVFETVAGDEKRRLSWYSERWADASDVELRALLAHAECVRKPDAEQSVRGDDSPGRDDDHPGRDDDRPAQSALADVEPREHGAEATTPHGVRTFRYPGGRYWTVCVGPRPEGGGEPALRFTAGARNIELATWPAEWADYSDEQLVELLRWAAPRLGASAPPPGTPRRRWDDQADRRR